MWTKDDYQEHMLGYLAGVQAQIDHLSYLRILQHDLNGLHTELDNTSELLWWLIDASDEDWEELRNPLEASCDELLRALHRVSYAHPLTWERAASIRSTVYVSATIIQHEPKLA